MAGRDKGRERHDNQRIRFHTPEDLEDCLKKSGKQEIVFKVYPISGKPESFRYEGTEKIVIRLEDGSFFDNMEDFLGYTFQCDSEGYPNTEYIDVEMIMF